MNTVLWPATWGYYLDQIVTGAVPDPGTILPAARDHFNDHVRARGHFPILRIGRQPYGVLPVCGARTGSRWKAAPLDAPLASLLARLRTTWENSVAERAPHPRRIRSGSRAGERAGHEPVLRRATWCAA